MASPEQIPGEAVEAGIAAIKATGREQVFVLHVLEAALPAIQKHLFSQWREGLEKALMIAEELDAAADTWEDRDDLPEHCRGLARRAREIHNALKDHLEQGGSQEGEVYDPVRECCCGHTAHWHGQEVGAPQGSGDCEYSAECGCKRFDPVAIPQEGER